MPALPPSVRLVDGQGGLPTVVVRHARRGHLDVVLQGAHVTRWIPPGRADVLWLSPTATFAPGTAVRGGVPLCFPWFGGGPDGTLTPSHGYARLTPWRLLEATEHADGVELVLGLDPAPGGDGLAATYRITLGAALGLELAVRNVAAVPVGFEAALHTYLAVSDVRDVAVTGLGGARYLDRLGGPDLVRQDVDVLRLTGETDRIYQGTDATVVVHDAAAARRLAVAKAGSASTVVWNPWAATGEAMADVGPAWSSMLCVETANVREHAVRLAPGTEHVMATSIAVLDPV
ncbi:D-hexose-6-phosphate mutarotase [Actinotalea sp.]|uniref:D-hexose-6-phosphate mutarotase n=1 Tax=Actinotalea sp. TaxID=1872145 RepID=UPI002D0E2006|nr:D-hexose-6-phosphate mutarotase [Actinotalea sp.]HQY32887.1 D-hexose-6-phosphate mutarotase [Actinotalea sp.]HRA49879.1 D-hexose-6-phosphate mutarotase [Actinotalea sp.]